MDLPRKEIWYHLLSVDHKIRACGEGSFVVTCPLLFTTSDLVAKLTISDDSLHLMCHTAWQKEPYHVMAI